MSNQGIRGYYLITEKIRDELLKDINVKTVTTGDISQINLGKQDIFPLAHILVNNVTVGEQTLRVNLNIMSMDIVNQSKDEVVDKFQGNTNEQDILNTQLAVLNKLIQVLGRGDLYTDKYQLDGEPICDPFYDRFENNLAGWNANVDVIIYNDITIC
jgi:hypothetical protein|tara:strand:- start:596 stop:1066 length:471 start_codon:yes stop_codon:yes gene_type:complete